MQIKNKCYPYPVIAYDNDSYDGSTFENDAEYITEAHYISFALKAEIKDACLQDMLKNGKVKYAHHVECQQTCYRELVITDEEETVLKIHESRVSGLVQICTFLIANEDIKAYSNPAFNRDYRGFRFDIDKGCVLAVGNQINMMVEKEKDDIANTSSIFAIRKNTDPSATEFYVITNEQKIVVLMPEKACAQYKNVSTSYLIPVLHAMVIQPALMQVLFELKEAAMRNELFNYEGQRWYRSLQKTAENLSIKFDETSLATMDVLKYTQQFLDSPAMKGLEVICSSEEDDQL